MQIVDTEAEQKAMGVAIAKGILKTLGIAWIEPVTEKVLTLDLQQLRSEGYTDIRIRL